VSALALRCRVCEEVSLPAPLETCPRCDGPNDVAYDWPHVHRTVTHAAVAAGPSSLWRYAGLLPAAPHVDLGAGWTPLVHATRLSALLGIDLHLKLETGNPTLSFKDRIATMAVATALDHGVGTLCCSSTGNLGDAVAAASAAAGLETILLAPAGTRATIASAAGARIFSVAGTVDDCRRLELQLATLFPWGFLDGNLHAFASEGAKTIAFELSEQLGWHLPDVVVCPAGSGTLLAKLAQGFAELRRAGLTGDAFPRLYAGQAGGASPIADAFGANRRISRVRPQTSVRSLAVGSPLSGELAIGAAQASGGAITAVPESRIAAHTALLAEHTGVFADRAAGVALGALLDAVASGEVAQGERVVLVVTGAGLKPEADDRRVETQEIEPTIDDLLAHL
jgi:threonine synthase